jgi:hypothetical protein
LAKIFTSYQIETSAKVPPVILSETKDLVFSMAYKILQSLRSFRMTIYGTSAEVSTWYHDKTKAIPEQSLGTRIGTAALAGRARPAKFITKHSFR